MAVHGEAEGAPFDRVRADLDTIHREGAAAWRSAGGAADLRAIEALEQVRRSMRARPPTPKAEAVWAAVCTACHALLPGYVQAALAYYGYPYIDPNGRPQDPKNSHNCPLRGRRSLSQH
jgi:hypothetical protein